MKKVINQCHVEGLAYEHKLDIKTSGPNSKNPGVQFINGELSIATDDDTLNIVKVHFSYVTPTFGKDNKVNATFGVLKDIIDGKIGCIMDVGKENAGKLRIDTAIGLNEFPNYREEGAPMIVTKRNEGGFVHQVNVLCKPEDRATFNTDILITGTNRVEANEERDLPEKLIVRGYIFDFRGAILPVEFSALNPRAMDYFEGLEATPNMPVFTRVQGSQISRTVMRKITEENAFGEARVREVPNSQKDFVITWALPEPYGWDTEDSILASELADKMTQREIHLAEVRKRNDDYRASQGNAIGAVPAANVASGDYDF